MALTPVTQKQVVLNWQYTPQSSNVAAFAWVGLPHNKLYVRFKGGGGGYYGGVDYEVYRRFQRAVSKGKFVHRVLKPTYPWTKT